MIFVSVNELIITWKLLVTHNNFNVIYIHTFKNVLAYEFNNEIMLGRCAVREYYCKKR